MSEESRVKPPYKSEVYNMDCFELLKTLPDKSVDLFLQDTPFGVTQNEWDVKPDLAKMWPEWLRVGKENTAYMFFATQPFASDLVESNRKMFRYDLIWYKVQTTGFLNANKMPLRSHESVLVFYRKLPTYNPQMNVGKLKQKGRRDKRNRQSNYGDFKDVPVVVNDIYFPESVLQFTTGDNQSESDHPTQKPLDLIRYLVKTYSNPGDTVFDGYAGSGTTPVACEVEGRNCIAAETDESYFKIIQRRLKEAKAQASLFTSENLRA